MKMMWPHLDCFPGNIYNFVFLDKKKIQIPKILSTWFLFLI